MNDLLCRFMSASNLVADLVLNQQKLFIIIIGLLWNRMNDLIKLFRFESNKKL